MAVTFGNPNTNYFLEDEGEEIYAEKLRVGFCPGRSGLWTELEWLLRRRQRRWLQRQFRCVYQYSFQPDRLLCSKQRSGDCLDWPSIAEPAWFHRRRHRWIQFSDRSLGPRL